MTEQLKPGEWIDEMAEVPSHAWPQPVALRLADELNGLCVAEFAWPRLNEAAAELRRLHALCAEWEKKAATWLASPEAAQRLNGYRELAQRLNAAEQVNAQLLEALEQIIDLPEDSRIHYKVARRAIASAKEKS
jgi:hypothetical protein